MHILCFIFKENLLRKASFLRFFFPLPFSVRHSPAFLRSYSPFASSAAKMMNASAKSFPGATEITNVSAISFPGAPSYPNAIRYGPRSSFKYKYNYKYK